MLQRHLSPACGREDMLEAGPDVGPAVCRYSNRPREVSALEPGGQWHRAKRRLRSKRDTTWWWIRHCAERKGALRCLLGVWLVWEMGKGAGTERPCHVGSWRLKSGKQRESSRTHLCFLCSYNPSWVFGLSSSLVVNAIPSGAACSPKGWHVYNLSHKARALC